MSNMVSKTRIPPKQEDRLNGDRSVEEIQMQEEALRRRKAIRNLIRECRKEESGNKHSKVDFKKEIMHY